MNKHECYPKTFCEDIMHNQGEFKKLRKKSLYTILLAMLITNLCGSAIPFLQNSISIRGIGNISTAKIFARSGSPQDIQDAVDAANAAGGGNVFIPSGIFDFSIDPNKVAVNNLPVGVIIPGGVNIFGNQTTLSQPADPPAHSSMFLIDGYNGNPVRISGIYFKGYVMRTEDPANIGITIISTNNFRIDHCNFTDFSWSAIELTTNYRQSYPLRGVIDHNSIDNPYKDNLNIPNRLWGYGIGIHRDDYTWVSDIDSILGHYDDNPCVVYIEDNTFRRNRHSIAANGGGHYVARHNYFTEMIISWYGSYVDAHGSTGPPPAVGTRAVEIYENTIENSPTDNRSTSNPSNWGSYTGIGTGIRGGGGVIFNNTYINFQVGAAIQLYSDASWEQCKPHDIWIWDNIFENVAVQISTPGGTYPTVEGVDYFLYAKPNYTSYPYPHPLTLD